ncbi:VCBS repeat containing protein [Hyalomma marginatum]|uniref:VCBS repeat containing protein n=1 Tax=Hyalomma marginatum TaxID=34627 RepID=A0A8S4BZQ2_9ACAR|nr:VCBS repeat containing protein [Hyalomma marginatum]CAG7589433.1 VCBS repeat containing protein [Hyalomma marginatum]
MFAPAIDYVVGNGLHIVAIADFNKDGKSYI